MVNVSDWGSFYADNTEGCHSYNCIDKSVHRFVGRCTNDWRLHQNFDGERNSEGRDSGMTGTIIILRIPGLHRSMQRKMRPNWYLYSGRATVTTL